MNMIKKVLWVWVQIVQILAIMAVGVGIIKLVESILA